MNVRLATHAMGTRFELVLCHASEQHALAVGEECVREIELWHRRLSRFTADSDVARINRGAGAWLRLDAELFELLRACEEIRAASDGLFDVCAGAREVGMVLDERTMAVMVTGEAKLDLGGVAKGFVLDQCGGLIRQYGIETALVHGGTSAVLGVGTPPDQTGWKVAVGDGLVVTLRDECLAVSGVQGRVDVEDGIERSHIVDPRSGVGVMLDGANRNDAAIVVGPRGVACDAWTKPVILGGKRPERLPGEYRVGLRGGSGGWSTEMPGAVQLDVKGGSVVSLGL